MSINSSDADAPPGWPFVNYAQREYNTFGRPLGIPRFPYEYLVEFQLSPRALLDNITNIGTFLNDRKLYLHLKSITHPTPSIKTETLRSYNKYIKVPTVMEFPAASMTFHDDATSIVAALWKEYIHFYSHLGSVGEGVGAGRISRLSSVEEDAFQYTYQLTGEEVRSSMDTRPSLGMKLKPNDKRLFFESIAVYDLGTDPDALNIYWYHHPFFTSWDHQPLDTFDRDGRVEVNVGFEYESYYFVLGQNRDKLAGIINSYLDFLPPTGDLNPPLDSGVGRHFESDKTGSQLVDNFSNSEIASRGLGDRDSRRFLVDDFGGIDTTEEFGGVGSAISLDEAENSALTNTARELGGDLRTGVPTVPNPERGFTIDSLRETLNKGASIAQGIQREIESLTAVANNLERRGASGSTILQVRDAIQRNAERLAGIQSEQGDAAQQLSNLTGE